MNAAKLSALPRIVVTVRGGAVTEVCCDRAATFLVVDHDNLEAGDTFDPTFQEIEGEPLHIAAFIEGYKEGLSGMTEGAAAVLINKITDPEENTDD